MKIKSWAAAMLKERDAYTVSVEFDNGLSLSNILMEVGLWVVFSEPKDGQGEPVYYTGPVIRRLIEESICPVVWNHYRDEASEKELSHFYNIP